jgi:hypothetical protein
VPKVHHAAHEQQCHQCPTAADAIRTVAKPKHYATRGVAAKTAMADQEGKRVLGSGKTYVLELRPLVGTRRYEQKGGDE